MNKPLAFFGGGFAVFGGIMLLIDLVVPHTKEGTFSVGSWLTGPVGYGLMIVGAALFLLAVKPEILVAIPIVGKFFQEKPAVSAAPPALIVPASEDKK